MTVFENFPYDVIFELSKLLDLDDIVHLSQTCRQLRACIFGDEQVARKVVGAHHFYTDEALMARENITTYRQALCAIYERRNAFSNVRPFAAQVVGQGHSFLYRCGVLCVQRGSIITVSNLRSAAPSVQFNIRQLVIDREYRSGDTFELMHYRDDILAVLVASFDGSEGIEDQAQESSILLVRTISDIPDSERIIRKVDIGSITDSMKLFVRHTSEYMYYGLHNTQGRDGHRKWKIRGCTLDWNKSNNDVWINSPLLIEDFHGNDVGSTVAFAIHDGYFYAVSNQGTYEVEEVDWTSFYHCVRFPLDNNVEDALERDARVYRRQHAEGAIHDSWTDLTLQHDERTNDLYIVESRREWVGATSKQARTFYTSKMQFSTPAFADNLPHVGFSGDNTAQTRPLPDDDILTTLLDSSHTANYMPTPEQYSWTRHPEFATCNQSSRPFTLAKTKYRAYNYSSSTFIDLVEDDNCCPDRPPNARPCLRLRMGSRRPAPFSFTHEHENGKHAVKYDSPMGTPPAERRGCVDSTQYRYSAISMWPPLPSKCACAARLHGIVNPVFRSDSTWGGGGIRAVSDERSMVYMVKPSGTAYSADGAQHGAALGTIVIIDFGRPASHARLENGARWERRVGQDQKCESGTCA